MTRSTYGEMVTRLPQLAKRPADSNKGDFGSVLVVAGSVGMSGAAVLTATAALRSGAGLVRLAVPVSILPIVAAANPCYITVGLPEDDEGRLAAEARARIIELSDLADVIAIGPGLSRSTGLSTLVEGLLQSLGKPIVLDADGLNAITDSTASLKSSSPRILTPHPGEMARLTKCTVPEVQANRQDAARRFAAEHEAIVVLKGHGTIVTDGTRTYVNSTGNPGMAKGGTGDVLTGMIAAFVGQGLREFEAAQLGVYLHGLAGDLAREDLGEVSLIASDLLDYLPRAFLRHPVAVS